ncbi:hypothetical protein ACFLXG_04070, partial [Chloroflexota bacterium]
MFELEALKLRGVYSVDCYQKDRLAFTGYLKKMSSTKNSGIFYGYWILAVSFLCVFIFSGASIGAFSLFLKHLQTEFGWGRGEIMIA